MKALMKTKLLLVFIVFFTKTYSQCTDYVNIPDTNFKSALITNSVINTDGDEEISCEEATAFTGKIDVSRSYISDLTGIEAFENITELNCNNNELTTIDVSNNIALQDLSCGSNNLANLDLSSNTALITLFCGQNNLTSLDLSNNTTLITVTCYINNLTSLNVSGCTALLSLNCYLNNLTSLDLSSNTVLAFLDCNNNELTSLDVSNNTLLRTLECSNNSLTNFDVSDHTILTRLECFNNELTSLNVSNCTALAYIDSQNNKLTSIDLSNNLALGLLNCGSNNLKNLNLANGNNIRFFLRAENNPNLTCIQVDDVAYSTSNWTFIDDVASFSTDCNDNCFVNIPDANFKSALITNSVINTDGDEEISCEEAFAFTGKIDVNRLSISDLTGIEAFENITELECFDNDLTSLDVSSNTALESLVCGYNTITSLNISNNRALKTLLCRKIELESLDVSNNSMLETLNCRNNNIKKLDLENNTALKSLTCFYNSLESLNLSNSPELTTLNCRSNNIESLNVSNNRKLEYLDCRSNAIESLDVSNNSDLTFLSCHSNNLVSLNVANGNNTNFSFFRAEFNESLTCIQVDNVAYSASNWPLVDDVASFSTNCTDDCLVNIPDANFKAYLTAIPSINTNGDEEISCEEAAAHTGGISIVNRSDIEDLTGIEAFVNIKELYCYGNDRLTKLDLSKSTELVLLWGFNNKLTSLDLSNSSKLSIVICSGNNLTSLNIANGNNTNLGIFRTQNNPNLTCIQVDDVAYSTSNWNFIDDIVSFSTDCSIETSSKSEISETKRTLDTVFNEAMTFYPNPINDVLTIKLLSGSKLEKVQVFNLLGEEVFTSLSKVINVGDLASGVYLLKVSSTEGKIATRKIVKK